jgi:hypothetical protein
MPGKFQVYKDKAGEYRFRLRNAEGSIVMASEGYKQYDGVMNGVNSVKKNCGAHVEDTTVGQKLPNPKYSVFLGTDKGYKYTLMAPNGEPIGFEAEHPNKSDVMAVIEEVKKCGDATVEDMTGHAPKVVPVAAAAAAPAAAAVEAAPVVAAAPVPKAGASETMIELIDVPTEVKKKEIVTFKGKLVRSDGKGVAGAIIRLMEHDRSYAFDQWLAEGATRDDGTFAIDWKARKTDWWGSTAEIYAEFRGDADDKPSKTKIYNVKVK